MKTKKIQILFLIILALIFSNTFFAYGSGNNPVIDYSNTSFMIEKGGYSGFSSDKSYGGGSSWHMVGRNNYLQMSSYLSGDLNTPSISSNYFVGGFLNFSKISIDDFNGDGINDIIGIQGGSIRLVNIEKGNTIWSSKNLGFSKIFGVFDIFGDGNKYIFVSNGKGLFIIEGRTGLIKRSYDNLVYHINVFDILDENGNYGTDGIKELIFEQAGGTYKIKSFKEGFDNVIEKTSFFVSAGRGAFLIVKIDGYINPVVISSNYSNPGSFTARDAITGNSLGTSESIHQWFREIGFIKNNSGENILVVTPYQSNSGRYSYYKLTSDGLSINFELKYTHPYDPAGVKRSTNEVFTDLKGDGNYSIINTFLNLENNKYHAVSIDTTSLAGSYDFLIEDKMFLGSFNGGNGKLASILLGDASNGLVEYSDISFYHYNDNFDNNLELKTTINKSKVLTISDTKTYHQNGLQNTYMQQSSNLSQRSAVFDINNDGNEEIFLATQTNSGIIFKAINSIGGIIGSYNFPEEVTDIGFVNYKKVINDSESPNLILSGNDGNIYIINSINFNLIKKLSFGDHITNIISGDMNNNGRNELAFINSLGNLVVLDSSSSSLINKPVELFKKTDYIYSPRLNNLRFVDLDGDGNLELLVVQQLDNSATPSYRLIAFDYNGNQWINPITEQPFQYEIHYNSPEVSGEYASAVKNRWYFSIIGVGNYNGDKVLDISVDVGTSVDGGHGRSLIISGGEFDSATGKPKLLRNWISTYGAYSFMGAQSDINGDGLDQHNNKRLGRHYSFSSGDDNYSQIYGAGRNNHVFFKNKDNILYSSINGSLIHYLSGGVWNTVANPLSIQARGGLTTTRPSIIDFDDDGFMEVFQGGTTLIGYTTRDNLLTPLWHSVDYLDGYRYFQDGKIYYSSEDLMTKYYIEDTNKTLTGSQIEGVSIGNNLNLISVKNGLGEGKNVIFVGSSDGYLYAIDPSNGKSYWNFTNAFGDSVGEGFYIGFSIGRMIWTDINGNGKGELILSAGDGNIYIINNANLASVPSAFDGSVIGQQRSTIPGANAPLCANWSLVEGATGYKVVFYYFDDGVRENIGEVIIHSSGTRYGCLEDHNGLSPSYTYRAEVISFNDITQSQSRHTLGSRVADLEVKKHVMKTGDPDFDIETTQYADQNVTYRIRIYNHSIMDIQGSGSNAIKIIDRLPTRFAYEGNTHTAIQSDTNTLLAPRPRRSEIFDGSRCDINQSLSTGFDVGSEISYEDGARLIWVLCPSDFIPAGGFFELYFDVRVR